MANSVRRRLLCLTVATIAASLLTLFTAPKATWKLPDYAGKNPVLAAELVRSASEIDQVYDHGNTKFRGDLESTTVCDFFFIAAYGSMYFALGRFAGGKIGRVIAWCAAGAMALDVAENIGILRTIHAAAATDALAQSTRVPSLAKWSLLAVVWTLLGVFLQQVRTERLPRFAGCAYMFAGVTAVFGLIGLFGAKMTAPMVFLVLATLTQLVWLIRRPG